MHRVKLSGGDILEIRGLGQVENLRSHEPQEEILGFSLSKFIIF
jgi:hypothetical protein